MFDKYQSPCTSHTLRSFELQARFARFQQFVNYITANQAVAESADRIAASVAARGTPEFTQAFQTALIDHARDFGVAEERTGALELVNAYNEENPITPDPGGDDSADHHGDLP